MARPRHDPAEAGERIADALEQAGLPYALGGALALAVAGVPRGTTDVDVNIFIEETEIDQAIAALSAIGIVIDAGVARAHAQHNGMFVGSWDGMRIDVFLPSIPFSREAQRTRTRVTGENGWSGWFLSAESVAVFKLLFFRGKDVVDLERLVAANAQLDHAYVRRWIVDMMGEDDPRVERWDDLVRRFGSP